MRRYCVSVAVAVACFASVSSAYDIKTKTPVLKLSALHEMMTRSAAACLDRSWSVDPSTPPRDCWTSAINGLAATVPASQFSELERSVRWADDPTRQGKDFGYPKLGLSLKYGCTSQVAASKGVDTAGLLCSSHYGRLQFLHAMRGVDDRDSETTRLRILAWAKFAYQVASGDKVLMEQSLCTAAADRPALKDAFKFDDPTKCSQRKRWGNLRPYPPYTVRTLFTLECANPFQSVTCDEMEDGQAQAMLAARGSLLHLIQDSYSQAHAHRSVTGKVDEKGPFEPKIVCRLPTSFFDYSKQNPDVHGMADHVAVLDSTCSISPPTDDPVTASAVLLWHLKNKRSADQFVNYLASRVIGNAPLKN